MVCSSSNWTSVRNNIGPDGAQALAGLRQSTKLSTMTLGLADNSIGDGGAKALATLYGRGVV